MVGICSSKLTWLAIDRIGVRRKRKRKRKRKRERKPIRQQNCQGNGGGLGGGSLLWLFEILFYIRVIKSFYTVRVANGTGSGLQDSLNIVDFNNDRFFRKIKSFFYYQTFVLHPIPACVVVCTKSLHSHVLSMVG